MHIKYRIMTMVLEKMTIVISDSLQTTGARILDRNYDVKVVKTV